MIILCFIIHSVNLITYFILDYKKDDLLKNRVEPEGTAGRITLYTFKLDVSKKCLL